MSARARIQFPAEGAYPRAMRQCCAVIAAWLCLSAAGVVHGQCHYDVTVVTGPPCFPDPNIGVNLLGINDFGQACGWQATCGQFGNLKPIVWTKEQGIILLPLPEGATRGQANDINNVLGSDGFGQVVCTLAVPALNGERAFLYDDGVWTELGLLPGATIARAFSINDQTEVVGECHNSQVGPFQAFHWSQGVLSSLDLPLGPQTSAEDINDYSTIVGWMGTSGSLDTDAFIHNDNGAVINIGRLPGAITSEPTGVNNHDVVTGKARMFVKSGSVPRRSWVFQEGRLIDLGGFPDSHQNVSEGINDAGQIVGVSHADAGGSGETPYLWQDGQLFRLEDLIDLPSTLSGLAAASAINEAGQIAGRAGSAAGCCSHGIILTPVNRPLGDVNIDCEVDGADLALILQNWGPCQQRGSCLCDLVTSATFQPPGDGVVDGADLAVVLGNWTSK